MLKNHLIKCKIHIIVRFLKIQIIRDNNLKINNHNNNNSNSNSKNHNNNNNNNHLIKVNSYFKKFFDIFVKF